MGQTLLTIADLSQVWIEADVFEADLELVKVGMTAAVTLPYLPGQTYPATIEYVYPYLEEQTRTGRIRLSLANPDGELKPGMYAQVSLQANIGHKLSVPEEAIIVAGDSRVVFVDIGAGRLKPVTIKAGRNAQAFVEVLDGRLSLLTGPCGVRTWLKIRSLIHSPQHCLLLRRCALCAVKALWACRSCMAYSKTEPTCTGRVRACSNI